MTDDAEPALSKAEAIAAHTARIERIRRRAAGADRGAPAVLAAFRRGLTIDGLVDYSGQSLDRVEGYLRDELRVRARRCKHCGGQRVS